MKKSKFVELYKDEFMGFMLAYDNPHLPDGAYLQSLIDGAEIFMDSKNIHMVPLFDNHDAALLYMELKTK